MEESDLGETSPMRFRVSGGCGRGLNEAPNPAGALEGYIGLMREWGKAVRDGRLTDELSPVNVEPTEEWANELEARLDFLDREVLSRYPHDLKACGS